MKQLAAWGMAGVVLGLSTFVPGVAVGASLPADDLAGTWSCRTAYGIVASVTVRADRDAIVVTDSTNFVSRTIVTRLVPSPPQGWHFETSARASGSADEWNGNEWTLNGVTDDGRGTRPYHTAYQLVDAQTLRISRWTNDRTVTGDVALCRRGNSPPDPSICVTPNVPAVTLRAAMPQTPPMAAQQGVQGTVQVLVMLDADSNVTSTRISSSTSVMFNAAAIDAVRHSMFRTAMRDCRPIPSEYLFSVRFN
jgi:TonB family protein